jgi:DNA-binding Lrp family transcriptional regulator
MTVHAYVLIQTEVGRSVDVARRMAEIDGVVLAEDVTGPYDVIARTEAKSIDDLGRLVVGHVQSIEGITRTITCPVVNL